MTRTTSTIIEKLRASDERVADYAQGVMNGSILVGEKIQLAVRRCVQDLIREEQAAYRWRFDPEQGSRPIRFIEKFMKPQGGYESFDLLPWQCFFEANLFGWMDKITGERRFQHALLAVAGGNGKTPLVAGTAIFFASQLGIKDCNVDVFANSKDQADIMMNDCTVMIESSPTLSKYFDCKTNGIIFSKSGEKKNKLFDGIIKSHSADARRLDGIRPTAALIDEEHGMRNYRVLNHCERSLNKAKENQLLLKITTMGYVLDGPLMDDYQRGDAILKGIYPEELGERELVLIYELDKDDDIEDSGLWIKANPSLGVLLQLSDLEQTWARNKSVDEKRLDFLTKQLNLFTKADEAGFVDFELLEKNRDCVDVESLHGLEAFGGFDIGASEDHCGVFLELKMPDGRFFFLPHAFVPERKAELDGNRLPYGELEKRGLLTIVPGRYVDQQYIIDWFDERAKEFVIRAIGYDPANATLLVRALESFRGEGKMQFVCEPIRQGPFTLNAPMKHLREQFLDGKIVHNQNKLYEWYVNNVRLRKDFKDLGNENWMPKKASWGEKIDGFMAGLNAHATYMRYCSPYESEESSDPGVEFIQLSFA